MPPPRYAAGGPPGPGMGWDERPGGGGTEWPYGFIGFVIVAPPPPHSKGASGERWGHRAIVGFWVHKVRIHGLWRKEEKFNFIRSAL